eukprot:TRINITY_DN24230_c0_g1_i1.p2 TRINITY_DN24230_c0_g1~~TRINITY_DN24230_c0_g1_i1.p2  ORF type:complete len:111 (+),score=25.00 TRINITY_DN24230_c0_g1_i1:149-481(+)
MCIRDRYNPYALDVDRDGNLVAPSSSSRQKPVATSYSSPPPRTTSRFDDREDEATPRSGESDTSEDTEMGRGDDDNTVSYTHLRAHETPEHLVCRLLLEKKNKKRTNENK